MKKIIFILGIAISNLICAQNEWNSVNNSTTAMFRNGNVAIGTSAATLIPFAVKNSIANTGTNISFGGTSITNFNNVHGYIITDNVIDILSAGSSSVLTFSHGGNKLGNFFKIVSGSNTVEFNSANNGSGITRPIVFSLGGFESLKINTDGKIGIGQPPSYPAGYKLYVTDGILTEKVKVAIKSTTAWSDFVFEPDYKLLTLEETDAYVKKHKHLPNIPSAVEVVQEGIDVATMDAKLLQKIEELTLYMIAFKKENDEQKKINDEQKLEHEKLKKDIELLKNENEKLKYKLQQ